MRDELTVRVYVDAEIGEMNRHRYDNMDEDTELGWLCLVTFELNVIGNVTKSDVKRAECKLVDMNSPVSEDNYYTSIRFDNSDDSYTNDVPEHVTEAGIKKANFFIA